MVNVLNVVGMLKQFERFTGFQKFYNCWVNSLTFKNSLLARTLTPTQPPPSVSGFQTPATWRFSDKHSRMGPKN